VHGVCGGASRELAGTAGMRPRHYHDDAPLGAGFGVAMAFAGVGIALIALSSGSGRASGLVLLISGVIICAGTLLEGAKRAENRKWLRRRRSFWIEKADGSTHEVTYGYVLNLSPAERQQLLARDEQMEAWFRGEWSTEALALTVETVAANPLKRLWLWLVLPRRFREP
jgi:hypothetical protein